MDSRGEAGTIGAATDTLDVRRALALLPRRQREATVLRLLRGTLSLREIGQELHLSPNTIKTHTRVIYRKLGVSSRGQAVEQGRRAGIC